MNAVEAKDLFVAYDERDILRNLCFSVPEGAFLVIIGPNGSGKTTLLKALLRILKPSKGSLKLFGENPGVHSNGIGYVPQIKSLDRTFPATAIELVKSGETGRWPWRISRSDRERLTPYFESVSSVESMDAPLCDLSGGELQRIYLARALAQKPRLLLLDEPLTGIDVVGEQLFEKALLDYCQTGQTVALVTHDLEVARHRATHVLLLNQDQIAFGTPDEVTADAALGLAYLHHGCSHG